MITVFTPTFNREHTLERLFNSLKRQTCLNFEWIVVDDGSNDNTLALLESFKEEVDFDINIISQINSGKHIAINLGVKEASTNWFFIVDSDDKLASDAVKVIDDKIKELTDRTVGVAFRKAHLDGRIIGAELSDSPYHIHATPSEASRLFAGDLAYIFKTKSLALNLFPNFQGEKFVPELYIWNKIADNGLIEFWGKEIIYLCEYMEDGYSFNFKKNLMTNPKGFSVFYKDQIFRESEIKFKIKNTIRYLQCIYYRFKK